MSRTSYLASLVLPVVLIATLGVAGCGSKVRVAVPEPAVSAGLVIRNVHVFQGSGSGLLKSRDVFVSGDRIERIVPTGSASPPRGARVIDGNGGTLLPGFIDLHVHVGGLETPPWTIRVPNESLNLQRMLYAGVTTAVDLGGPLEGLRKTARDIAEGKVAGPDLFYTGPHLALRDGHPAALVSLLAPWPVDRMVRPRLSFEVRDEKDVARAVEQVAAHGGSFLKITIDDIPVGAPKLDLKLAKLAVNLAHERGLRVLAHIGSNDDLRVALDAGVDGLAHGVYREPLAEELIDRLVREGVAVIPTVGVFNAIERLMHEGPEDSELFRELTAPKVRRVLADKPETLKPDSVRLWVEVTHDAREIRTRNLALMREKGVRILVGSDSNNVGWVAGLGFIRELEHMVEAGFSPAEAIEMATQANAAFLGLNDRGRIHVGTRADLVLVDGNPVEEISDVRRIAAVVKAGREVTRTAPYR